MEKLIKLEIESLQLSMTFFLMLIQDTDSGMPIEELVQKYAEDWYTQWSYTMTPWSVEVFMPLFKLLQDFETSNPNDVLLSFYWSKFDKFYTLMWRITPRLGKILNSAGWLGSKAPEQQVECLPYNGVFQHTLAKKLIKELQVMV
jgi:hypothetical protein